MVYLIGTDEAGYGPNLGPLAIGATLWRVPDELFERGGCDLYRHLQSVIQPAGSADSSSPRIAIGDSKELFKSRGSLSDLESSVLTMLSVCQQPVDDFFDLVESVANLTALQLAEEATYDWSQRVLPRDACRESIQSSANLVSKHLDDSEIHCLKIASTLLFPSDFNQGLERCGNKATLLSTATCQLVRQLLEVAKSDSVGQTDSTDRVLVMCDKHGGRAHYAGLLQQEMTESFVQVVSEARQESIYRWQEDFGIIEMRFIAKGESEMPIALASMIAKYLRELSMDAWNRFWGKQIPELVPTAGYPQDAKRFKKDIGTLQKKLKVGDRSIWRNK